MKFLISIFIGSGCVRDVDATVFPEVRRNSDSRGTSLGGESYSLLQHLRSCAKNVRSRDPDSKIAGTILETATGIIFF